MLWLKMLLPWYRHCCIKFLFETTLTLEKLRKMIEQAIRSFKNSWSWCCGPLKHLDNLFYFLFELEIFVKLYYYKASVFVLTVVSLQKKSIYFFLI